MTPPLGLYFHFPFCLAKCAYCDFASRPLRSPAEWPRLISALRREVRRRARGAAATVYLGGGTPSLCPPELVAGLLDEVRTNLHLAPKAEITLEANPATADAARLAAFRDAGVNRVSIGVQSSDDEALRMLGRVHTSAQAKALVASARKAGFTNVSCDLIYGLPGQTLERFQADLERVLSWEPDHLSLYALSLESGTRLAERVKSRELPEPEEDTAADMYEWARERLDRSGYSQYELSNFARKGFACRHNLNYWNNGDYLGFGPSAHSHIIGVRCWNLSDPDAYLQAVEHGRSPREGSEKLNKKRKIAEELMVGLRLTAGVPTRRLTARYGPGWQEPLRPALKSMSRAGLLDLGATLRLTSKGMLLSNVVFRELL